ncbi:MAG: DUF4988 domain-containing protein [Rikenellaceae bacterium]|nr:DUF4988 domain-containing protein [Rikenellaceae bacterium]
MRKKKLYAVALAAACAAFAGCKDYDSDIKNLQTQINANADAIAALQQAIAKGVMITGVTPGADGYKITFSDGTSVDLSNGKDGQQGLTGPQGEAGKDAPVPQLRVNAAKNWEMSVDGGNTWAELKDADGNSIADAKTYVADYVKIDESGYIVIGDKTTSFKYNVAIPSVTEDVDNRIAIITIPATATEPMKTLRVPMEGYFDRLFVSNITPVKGHATLAFTKVTLQSDVTLGGKEYKSGDVVYTTAGMPVVINPAQVNAGAMTFTFVANTGAAEPETMPVTLAMTQGSDAVISQTKAAPATGLWTMTGTVTDDGFDGFDNVALCAQNGNGTNTLSDYAFEIDVQAGATGAGAVASAVSQNNGSTAVLKAAADIIDSYAAFDDGSQEKDGYGIRRADQTVPADAPYTGDWEVYKLAETNAMLTKTPTPTTELPVVYTAVGLNGVKAESNVTVSFFAPIPEPAVATYSIADVQVQNADGTSAAEFTVNLGDLESALFPTVAFQSAWENLAKNFTVELDEPLKGQGQNSVKFYSADTDKGTSVDAVSDFNKIVFAIDNKTAAGEYSATFAYEDQAGNKTEVTISFFLGSPVATVEAPTGKEIANDGTEVTVSASDFTAKDGEEPAQTIANGIKEIVSASSTDESKMTVALDGSLTCTRVGDAPETDETVTVKVSVKYEWGVTYDLTLDVKLAAAAL